MADFTDIILSTAAKYSVDPALLYATIMTESSGNPQATRYEPRLDESSYGLGQILESTARGLGYQGSAQGLFDPATNLDYVSKYLLQGRQAGAQTPQQYATFYNTGRLGGTPTQGHLERFMQNYQAYPQAQTQGANIRSSFTPPREAAQSASLSQAASPSQRSYVVRPGDTLSGIAQRLLGSASAYPSLSGYRSGNPNRIYPGEVIRYG